MIIQTNFFEFLNEISPFPFKKAVHDQTLFLSLKSSQNTNQIVRIGGKDMTPRLISLTPVPLAAINQAVSIQNSTTVQGTTGLGSSASGTVITTATASAASKKRQRASPLVQASNLENNAATMAGAASIAGAASSVAGVNPIDNDSDNKKRTHRCSFPNCHKVYTKSSHLKAHQRTHTGKQYFLELPYLRKYNATLD